jgi:hypothetical protein
MGPPRAATSNSPSSILWRRLDLPGHDAARFAVREDGWELDGCAVFAHAGRACRLDYRVRCDRDGRTRAARVRGWCGAESVAVELAADADGWTRDGRPCPELERCVDVDLQFTPATNTLPVRRLALAVGAVADVRAAWLRFPELALEPLDQRYERLDPRRYRYSSAEGSFVRDLEVDAAGFVTHYPGSWRAELV